MTRNDDRHTLFHGTRAGFSVGGILLPPSKTGRARSQMPVTPGAGIFATVDPQEWVYGTTDFDLARAFAHAASGRGCPKVLEIVPMGDVHVDESTFDGEIRDAYRMEWAQVVRVYRDP